MITETRMTQSAAKIPCVPGMVSDIPIHYLTRHRTLWSPHPIYKETGAQRGEARMPGRQRLLWGLDEPTWLETGLSRNSEEV